MNTRKIIILASIGLALFTIVPTAPANARGRHHCNPLLFPFAVVATVVGTAAAIATTPLSRLWTSLLRPPPPAPAYHGAPLHHTPITALPRHRLPITTSRHIATGYGFVDTITSMGHGCMSHPRFDRRSDVCAIKHRFCRWCQRNCSGRLRSCFRIP